MKQVKKNKTPRGTKITIILPTSAYFMSGVRDFTLSLAKNMTGFDDQLAYRFQTVVDEICNNAIEHGSSPHDEVKITFITVEGESLEVAIEDNGTGKNKIAAEEMYKLMEKQKKENDHIRFGDIRGRGMSMIVEQWTDELHFENSEKGGLIVKAKKYIKKK